MNVGGDPLEPTNPGKPEGPGPSRLLVAFAVVVVLVVITAFVYAAIHARERLTPDEFCAGHGGVTYLDAGGWATPATATCRDGHAGKVYP